MTTLPRGLEQKRPSITHQLWVSDNGTHYLSYLPQWALTRPVIPHLDTRDTPARLELEHDNFPCTRKPLRSATSAHSLTASDLMNISENGRAAAATGSFFPFVRSEGAYVMRLYQDFGLISWISLTARFWSRAAASR